MDGGGKISDFSKFNDHCGNFVDSTRFEFTKGILKLLQLLEPIKLRTVMYVTSLDDKGSFWT